ncbi:putative membrane protein [Opitutaceae bacterium TAV1]|nr:membrane protein [Opitutaceae bacterium TAV5]EIQ01204.1 putative membrane protein [Opitutaceae bacterium TAV1]
MFYYLTTTLEVFLATALLAGLNHAPRPVPAFRWLAWTILAALAVGITTGRLVHPVTTTQLWTGALLSALFLAVLFAQLPFAKKSAAIGLVVTGLLAAAAGFRFGQDPNLGVLTATAVVNTDLLLNLAAMLFGFALAVTLGALLARLVRRSPPLRWPLLIANTALLLVPLSGQIVLALIRLKKIPLTRDWLSYVARTTNFPWLFTYIALGAVAVAALPTLLRTFRSPALPPSSASAADPARRKTLAALHSARRLAWGALLVAATATACQLYWDQVASRPLQRSDAARITEAADGNIHLALATLADNQLHRYEWIADDGKIVRFFTLNRHPGAVSPAVVFDACSLCGDRGYALRGDRVICIACGVNLVLPSVGKPGGCNPIIIENWTQTDTEILIPRASLAAGAQVFTTSVGDDDRPSHHQPVAECGLPGAHAAAPAATAVSATPAAAAETGNKPACCSGS